MMIANRWESTAKPLKCGGESGIRIPRNQLCLTLSTTSLANYYSEKCYWILRPLTPVASVAPACLFLMILGITGITPYWRVWKSPGLRRELPKAKIIVMSQCPASAGNGGSVQSVKIAERTYEKRTEALHC